MSNKALFNGKVGCIPLPPIPKALFLKIMSGSIPSKNGCLVYKKGHRIGKHRIETILQSKGKSLSISAHRAVFFYLNPSTSSNSIICHHCDNPECVNPTHLYAGTHKTNMADRKREPCFY